jgi:hypothetical protein
VLVALIRRCRPTLRDSPARLAPGGRQAGIALRAFPYPYCCALALGCDPDDLHAREDFLQVARFLNTTDETSMGRGLGLEASFGFWLYDGCGTCDFTLFRGLSVEPSENAKIMESLIRSRHLDSIHGYGDFSEGGFERRHAAHALDYLSARGLRVKIWVNHGGSLNTQQIGRSPGQRGDDPGEREYHTDLLLAYGIKFIERYDVVHTVGQDGRCRPIVDRTKQAWELIAYGARARSWKARSLFCNRLIEPAVLGDGQRIYYFKRFMGPCPGLERAGARELARQISRPVLEELEAKRGFMIVYTHIWRDLASEGVLPEPTQDALRFLAYEYRAGRIYVTTVGKLLAYNLVRQTISWTAYPAAYGVEIRILSLRDVLTGPRIPPLEELRGVTFYSPDPENTRIYLGDRLIDSLTTNAPDETGRASVSIPLSRQTFPAQ